MYKLYKDGRLIQTCSTHKAAQEIWEQKTKILKSGHLQLFYNGKLKYEYKL